MPAPSSEQGLLLLDVSAPATPAHLDRIQDQLARFLCDGDVAGTDRVRFETAVVELVGNVMEHAVARHDDVPVRMRVRITHDARDEDGPYLQAVLTDDAAPADVELDRATVDDDALSGRGLALVRACCDELVHEASAAGNRWSVRSRCTS